MIYVVDPNPGFVIDPVGFEGGGRRKYTYSNKLAAVKEMHARMAMCRTCMVDLLAYLWARAAHSGGNFLLGGAGPRPLTRTNMTVVDYFLQLESWRGIVETNTTFPSASASKSTGPRSYLQKGDIRYPHFGRHHVGRRSHQARL